MKRNYKLILKRPTYYLKLSLDRLGMLGSKCLCGFLDLLAHIRINTIKNSILPLTNILPRIRQVHRNIVHKMILLSRLFPKNFPQSIWLNEILIRNLMHKRQGMSSPLFMSFRSRSLLKLDCPVGCDIIGVCAEIAIDSHGSVTLEIEHWTTWFVDGDLLIIGAQTMTVGVGVRKQTGLQNWVGGGFDSRDRMRG